MKRHLFRRMGRFLRPQAPSLAGAAALAALSGLLALLVPLVAGWAVEAIGTGPGAADLTAVLRCCAAGLGAAVLSAVCSYGASAALVRVGQTVSYTLRKAAFQQITQLPVRYFDTHPAGDLISRVCYDVDTVNAALSTDLLQIGTSLLTVIGSFVMLLMLSPLLSGVFFLTVPLSVLLTRLQMKHIHPLFRRRSQELGALNSFAEERVSCQRAIRVYGVEAADLRQFAEKNDAASETYYKADCASTALGPSVNFINNLSLAAVSVFGALLYLGGGLSLGALSSFVLYSRKFSGPIRETAELLSDLQASVAAAERVLDLLDQPAEDGDLPGAREPGKLSGAISFRHVDFGYDPAHPVLRDFSADIPAGSMVAVVGPNYSIVRTLVDAEIEMGGLLSRTDSDSQIARLNTAAGDGAAVAVDPDVAELLAFSQEIARQLPGDFDITIAPVMDAWGFTFKTVAFVWIKQCPKSEGLFTGMGYWTRANAEICLLATRGRPKRAARDVKQVILSHVERHSQKPEKARRRIEALMGDVPRIELFARASPPGWDVWGNEVASDIRLAERM